MGRLRLDFVYLFMFLKTNSSVAFFALFLLLGCGGAGSEQLVQPTITVNFPERNRSTVSVNEMTESITVILWKPNSDQMVYGPFRARRIGSPSSAHSQEFSFPPIAVGNYRLTLTGWTQANETGAISGVVDSTIRVTSGGTIVKPDGAQYVADMRTSSAISDVVVLPEFGTLKVGSQFWSFLYGRFGSNDLGNLNPIPLAWFKFTWIEGREKLEIAGQNPGILSYRAVAPGIVKFRVSLQEYTSPELQMNFIP